jgi:hypothetical protein
MVPTTCAPFDFKASMWALLRFINSMETPALLMNAPKIVPREPAPYIAIRILFCFGSLQLIIYI